MCFLHSRRGWATSGWMVRSSQGHRLPQRVDMKPVGEIMTMQSQRIMAACADRVRQPGMDQPGDKASLFFSSAFEGS